MINIIADTGTASSPFVLEPQLSDVAEINEEKACMRLRTVGKLNWHSAPLHIISLPISQFFFGKQLQPLSPTEESKFRADAHLINLVFHTCMTRASETKIKWSTRTAAEKISYVRFTEQVNSRTVIEATLVSTAVSLDHRVKLEIEIVQQSLFEVFPLT